MYIPELSTYPAPPKLDKAIKHCDIANKLHIALWKTLFITLFLHDPDTITPSLPGGRPEARV